MKRIIGGLIAAIILLTGICVAAASATIWVDKTTAVPSDTVTITGTAAADVSIVIKIADEMGNIVFFDVAAVDANGMYSAAFIVPSDMLPGKLTITAGNGTDIATTVITVTSPSTTPTSVPTSTTIAAPTSTTLPTPKPSTTATPSPTQTTQRAESEPTPTQTSEDGQYIIIPTEISLDEKTGIITITISVDDLPEGTVAVETPNGKVIYVSDAVGGVIVIEVTEDEVNAAGQVELIALNDEMKSLATVRVQVLDENHEITLTDTADNDIVWLIVVYIFAGLVVLAVAVWILFRRRNKQSQDS